MSIFNCRSNQAPGFFTWLAGVVVLSKEPDWLYVAAISNLLPNLAPGGSLLSVPTERDREVGTGRREPWERGSWPLLLPLRKIDFYSTIVHNVAVNTDISIRHIHRGQKHTMRANHILCLSAMDRDFSKIFFWEKIISITHCSSKESWLYCNWWKDRERKELLGDALMMHALIR